jgi:hypothetical protein
MVAGAESQSVIEPVRKVVQVQLSIEEAYRLFTEDMSSWWPLESHSVGAEKTERCVFEGSVGGRIYEVQDDGSEAEWGTVKVWDPPNAVDFTWYPGREADTAQEVEVRFRSIPEGTELELIHRGWELLGDKAEETRAGYDSGWDVVLGHLVERSGA